MTGTEFIIQIMLMSFYKRRYVLYIQKTFRDEYNKKNIKKYKRIKI